MNENKIGIKIKQLRKEKKLTQKALAEKLGKVESTVRMWELGKNLPSPEALRDIAGILECSYTDLLVEMGYLSKKKDLELYIEDYLKVTQEITEIFSLINNFISQNNHIEKLINNSMNHNKEKEFLYSQKQNNYTQISRFKPLLKDAYEKKLILDKKIQQEKEKIDKETNDILNKILN